MLFFASLVIKCRISFCIGCFMKYFEELSHHWGGNPRLPEFVVASLWPMNWLVELDYKNKHFKIRTPMAGCPGRVDFVLQWSMDCCIGCLFKLVSLLSALIYQYLYTVHPYLSVTWNSMRSLAIIEVANLGSKRLVVVCLGPMNRLLDQIHLDISGQELEVISNLVPENLTWLDRMVFYVNV